MEWLDIAIRTASMILDKIIVPMGQEHQRLVHDVGPAEADRREREATAAGVQDLHRAAEAFRAWGQNWISALRGVPPSSVSDDHERLKAQLDEILRP